MFYQQNGAVEFVPTRAFGFTYERSEALEQLEGIIKQGANPIMRQPSSRPMNLRDKRARNIPFLLKSISP